MQWVGMKSLDRPTVEDAVLRLRSQESCASLVRDAYLDADADSAAQRFAESEEFRETWSWLAGRAELGPLLDLGAGRGIASFAMARRGAEVVAVEPDPSADIGVIAAARVLRSLDGASVIAAGCPRLPFRDASFSGVYARQVLHHLDSLSDALQDIARVLVPGGLLVAVREHVVDDDEQLQTFLAQHPIHQLVGGEGAFSYDEYIGAMEGSGLVVETALGPWDSVINAFPAVRDVRELQAFPSTLLRRRIGAVGGWIGRRKRLQRILWRRIDRPVAGRMFSFVARKPDG